MPAPISEVPESATPASRKHKVPDTSDSATTHRFDGTWVSHSSTNSQGYGTSSTATLIIRDGKTADTTSEATLILHDPRGWSDLPEAYKHLSPLYLKATNHADHLIAGGSDLMIRWSSGGRLVDWAPKTLPRELAQKIAGLENPTNMPVAVSLKGDELVFGKVVFHRVK